MELSIIIPAFNEEKRLPRTLQETVSYAEQNLDKYEIIVINDGSKDKTKEVALKFKDKGVRLLNNPRNMGKGFSIKYGMVHAKHDPILFMDSDLATPLSEIKKFYKSLNEGYDIVIASRNLKESVITVKQPKYRQLLGKTFPLLVKTLLNLETKDTQCGFKMFKRDAARKIFPRQNILRFAFDAEILFIAKLLDLKVKESPVVWTDMEGSSLFIIKDTLKMLRDINKIRYYQFRKRYK